MTQARNRPDKEGGQNYVSPVPKYVEAARGTFTVETQDSGAGWPHLDP